MQTLYQRCRMRNQKPRLALSLSRNLVEEEEEAALVKGRGGKYKYKILKFLT